MASSSRRRSRLRAPLALWRRTARLPRWRRLAARSALVFLLAGLLAATSLWLTYSSLARGYPLEKVGRMPERSVVVDLKGREMGRLHGQNRVIIPLDKVSPHFIEALLAREDNRFYRHNGVDFHGLARALVRNVRDRSFTQGASTLTMQLARSSFNLSGKTLHRKLLEVAVARRIERRMSKDQILELYVNRIFFGTGIYGVERASQVYFGKPAADLTLDEAAMLAAIIRGPNRFSPFRNYEVALSGRNMVLDRMVLQGRITEAQAAEARQRQTSVQDAPTISAQESYALDAVRRDLDRLLDAENEEDGGLTIYTTIDLDLQEAAEKAVNERLTEVEKSKGYPHPTRAAIVGAASGAFESTSPGYLQGAVIVFNNATGATLAVVGGRNFQESPFNRALLARRQVGSTFKPFVYTAAFQSGLFPTTLLSDGPVEIGGWKPKNSDGEFRGMQPAEYGLYKSRNTMTVRAGQIAGVERVAELAERVGLGHVENPSPQIFIGNLDATLAAITSAYTAFPNGGVRCRPYVIERIENREGSVIFRSGVQTVPVLSPGASWCVTQALQKVLSPQGTGASARRLGFKRSAAGKTGTTDDYKDAWFIGYDERITCGVWAGMDQPEKIMAQGYGSRVALPIWADVMKAAEKLNHSGGDPLPDVPTARADLCRVSGLVATGGCRAAGAAVSAETPVDLLEHFATSPCHLHTGQPSTWSRQERPARGRSGRSLIDRIFSIFR